MDMDSSRRDGRSRREFLAKASSGLLGGLAAWSFPLRGAARGDLSQDSKGAERLRETQEGRSRVSLVHGSDRASNTYRALKAVEKEVKAVLAHRKKVVIKPNMVSVSRQLSATHADSIEGMLEFFAPLVDEEILIAESAAGGTAAEGYDNYGYGRLQKNYRVRLVDLDLEPLTVRHVIDERFQPRPVRFSRLLLDPDVYLVSAAVLKTHDRVVTTLSLKNVAVGAIVKDTSFRWGRGSKGRNDKPLVHGGRNNEGIHYNLFQLAREVAPDLALIDGFQGMEGNGPVGGTPVDHGIAIASTDWLAADRVAVELMGFDIRKVGYLWFCAQGGLGQGTLENIDVVGERIEKHVKKYRPHDNIEKQYRWLQG